MNDTKKILVAVDGSEQSLLAVRYLSGVLRQDQSAINLFHVSSDIPEAFLDMGNIPGFHNRIMEITAWRAQIRKEMEEFMCRVKRLFIDAGFPSSAIKQIIHKKNRGVARDILAESRKNYSAVVVGRTGVSKLQDFLIGSVADKIVGKGMHIPIIIVGGDPKPKKIMVAFDGSEDAFKAVDSVALLADNTRCEVEICHVIRTMNLHYPMGDPNLFPVEVENIWLKEKTKKIESAMIEAQNRLINVGFSPDKVSRKILLDKPSRAQGIVGEAAEFGYETIVVGRRGLTLVEEFTMGRVGRKIVHMAGNYSVWVVS